MDRDDVRLVRRVLDGDARAEAELVDRLLPHLRAVARATLANPADVDDAVQVWSRPGFDTLVSLPHLRFTPYAHQVQAAGVALRRMRGRAVLVPRSRP